MEAVVFYRIIQGRIQKRDPEAGKTISATLEADYDKMDASLVEDALTKGEAVLMAEFHVHHRCLRRQS